MRRPLTEEELQTAVVSMPGWSVAQGKLHREYKFPGFAYAMGFMATAAPLIEKLDHHPEWANVYNRIIVDLVTHDAGGITQRDVELASLLEKIAGKLL